MEWFALLIPAAVSIILYLWFSRKLVWWELAAPMLCSLLFVALAKLMIEYIGCHDTEYWGGWAQQASYYEAWNEQIVWYETQTYKVGKETRTRTVRRTRIDYHPEYWELIDSNGCTHSIDKGEYLRLIRLFGNHTFRNLHRSYYTIDGDMYYTTWPNTDATFTPTTTAHSYHNIVAVADSVFQFEPVTPEDQERYRLFSYPPINGYVAASVLGVNDPLGERAWSMLNGKLGAKHQVRALVLVFHDQPLDAAFAQQRHWRGGNKNELILCVGLRGNEVAWGHCFSWSESEALKIECRDLIVEQKQLDLTALAAKVQPLIVSDWKRKEFKDFDYLTVPAPLWATILVYLLTFALSLGIAYWTVENDVDPEDERRPKFMPRFVRRDWRKAAASGKQTLR
jgi:hypothetical protein